MKKIIIFFLPALFFSLVATISANAQLFDPGSSGFSKGKGLRWMTCKVPFGNPYKNCAGYGICNFIGDPKADPSNIGGGGSILLPPTALPQNSGLCFVKLVTQRKKPKLHMRFSTSSMTPHTINKYFGQGVFVIEAPLDLPAGLASSLGVSKCKILPGRFQIGSSGIDGIKADSYFEVFVDVYVPE